MLRITKKFTKNATLCDIKKIKIKKIKPSVVEVHALPLFGNKHNIIF